MTQQRILLVDANKARAHQLRDAIVRAQLPSPISRDDGESAIMWVGLNDCNLCIISYELPTLDGLETLARIRTRRPNLPAIIFSESESQAVAIAAFRSGVLDFVPTVGDFARRIGHVARKELLGDECEVQIDSLIEQDPTLSQLPRARLEPTYQNRLRTIGRQLDTYEYRSINLLEVEGGFLARAYPPGPRKPVALEFPDKDFPRLVQISIEDDSKPTNGAMISPVVPTGYEDLLRAIGYKLDTSWAESITIAEHDDVVIVSGRWDSEGTLSPTIEPFQMFLREFEVDHLLNQAFNRRGKTSRSENEPREEARRGLRNLFQRDN